MRATFLGLLVAASVACDPESEVEPEPVGLFIAQQHDFVGYREWEAFSFDDPVDVPTHPNGVRTVYLNRRPDPGATEFAPGTIIVKENDDLFAGQIHAMVKRGGEYNVEGAYGWEWFDLATDDMDQPVIKWRGLAPPDGECYGCAPGVEPMTIEGGDCNACHAAAVDNDFVQGADLALEQLAPE